jgi:hypothetical protein
MFDHIAGGSKGVRVVSYHQGVLDTDMGKKSAKSIKPIAYDDSKYICRHPSNAQRLIQNS